ncbi:MAG: hypothetical protein ACK55Z_16795 [bacterium]
MTAHALNTSHRPAHAPPATRVGQPRGCHHNFLFSLHLLHLARLLGSRPPMGVCPRVSAGALP